LEEEEEDEDEENKDEEEKKKISTCIVLYKCGMELEGKILTTMVCSTFWFELRDMEPMFT